MKTKYFFLAALTGLALAGCSSDDFIADAPPVDTNEVMTPIMFSSVGRGMTRADFEGADAAAKLGNQFVVSGYKGSQTTWTANDNSIVFDNYLVTYAPNTAYTTASNTHNWEYVGVAGSPIAPAAGHGIQAQTIKYWDFSKPQYDFIAWSTGSKTAIFDGEYDANKVLVSAITPESATGEWPDLNENPTATTPVAYTFTGTAAALKECYISDLVTVKKADYYNASTKEANPVTLKFRQLGTKVRIGIYETVPGYSVKNVKFYRAPAVDFVNDGTDGNAYLFTTTEGDIYTAGTYTIYFPHVDQEDTDPNYADNNQAHIHFAPATGATTETQVDWGELDYTAREKAEGSTTESYLGRQSNQASMAGEPADNYYKIFLPNETGTNLNLRVDYTLESIDGSKEEIVVRGATAQVPLIYTQWKAGYAYTYLFKISDKTNGHTGQYDPLHPDAVTSDPTGLYPITFDAVVVNAEEDATQETITLVSTPSITTYQQNSEVVANNEYTVNGKDIFVTVSENNELVTLTDGNDGNAALYTITGGKTQTEAEVIDALSIQSTSADEDVTYTAAAVTSQEEFSANEYYTEDSGNYTLATVYDANATYYVKNVTPGSITGRNKLVLTEADFELSNVVINGADDNVITLPEGKALRFTPAASKTYAFVYTQTASTGTTEEYGVVGFNEDIDGRPKYRDNIKAIATEDADDVESDEVYFDRDDTTTPGTVTYTQISQYIGMTFSEDGFFYTLKAGEDGHEASDYEKATGTANSDVTYYYSADGSSFVPAGVITYADFIGYDPDVVDGNDQIYTDATGSTELAAGQVPASGTTYYKYNGTAIVPAVIFPQQTTGLYILDTTSKAVADETVAIDGMTYFDQFIKNNGVRYAKVIKVQ